MYTPFALLSAILVTIFDLVCCLLLNLLSLLPPLLAAAVLILAAAKWDKKHADFVFCGLAAAAALRLLGLILVFPINLLWGIFCGLPYMPSNIASSLLHVLGYVLAAGVVFVVLYLMGCAPVMGETVEQIKANVRASAADFFGDAKKAAEKVSNSTADAPAAAAAAATAADASAPSAATYHRRLKTNRGLLKYILLNFITCGIYNYFLIHNLARDTNEICQGDGRKTGGLLAFILLSFITCGIYSLVWWYKLCNRIAANGPRYNTFIQQNGATYLLWTIVGIFLCGLGPLVATYQVLHNMNALCAAYNRHNGLAG